VRRSQTLLWIDPTTGNVSSARATDAIRRKRNEQRQRTLLNSLLTVRKDKTKGRKMAKKGMVGKKVIVRGNVAGVHAGLVEKYDPATFSVTLTNARRLWRFYTRDKSGSISDICANGLKPNGGHSIGAKLLSTTIVNPNGLEISEMTDEAFKSVQNWEN
jgi:hypothetical protein